MNVFKRTALTLLLWAVMPLSGQAADNPRAKQFIVMGYQGIIGELASGQGPYVNTLLDLLEVRPDQQAAAIAQIKVLSTTYPNIMDFADQVSVLTAAVELAPLPPSKKIYTGESLENALRHLARGMKVTVYLMTGAEVSGTVNDYDAGRLWLRTPSARSFKLEDIRGIDAPEL